MVFNFPANLLQANGNNYNLDDMRRYLLTHEETLCSNHFIKTIIKDGKPFFSYDWNAIFTVAAQAGYLNKFIRTKAA